MAARRSPKLAKSHQSAPGIFDRGRLVGMTDLRREIGFSIDPGELVIRQFLRQLSARMGDRRSSTGHFSSISDVPREVLPRIPRSPDRSDKDRPATGNYSEHILGFSTSGRTPTTPIGSRRRPVPSRTGFFRASRQLPLGKQGGGTAPLLSFRDRSRFTAVAPRHVRDGDCFCGHVSVAGLSR